jgi:hypothetical protein
MDTPTPQVRTDVRRARRRTLRTVLFVAAAALAGLFYWSELNAGQECFDRIQVGMPFSKAEAILEGRGFVLTGGGVQSNQATMVYSRAGSRSVIICVPWTGEVSHKELGDREAGLRHFWRSLTETRTD